MCRLLCALLCRASLRACVFYRTTDSMVRRLPPLRFWATFREMFATLAGTAGWLGYAAQRRPPTVAGRRPTPERVALAHRMAAGSLSGSPAEIGERWRREQAAAANDASPVGVLLLSVGAPATADDVEEYLYNVFCDPEILTLPPALMWALKRPVAWVSTHPSPSPRPEPHPHLTMRSRELALATARTLARTLTLTRPSRSGARPRRGRRCSRPARTRRR